MLPTGQDQSEQGRNPSAGNLLIVEKVLDENIRGDESTEFVVVLDTLSCVPWVNGQKGALKYRETYLVYLNWQTGLIQNETIECNILDETGWCDPRERCGERLNICTTWTPKYLDVSSDAGVSKRSTRK